MHIHMYTSCTYTCKYQNVELLKVQQSGRSDSGQALTDANKYISELEKQLADALAASHESAELRADDQQHIAELEQQLADDQQRNSELEQQLADALEKIERCKKVYRATDLYGRIQLYTCIR